MVIAAIGERNLTTETRLEAERLLKVNATPRAHDFITAGPWADDVRPQREESAPWHYVNILFRADGRRITTRHPEEHVVVAIERFTKVLSDKSRPDAERADALRYIIHFVGDVHQPLHTTARVSEKFPQGDRGGNDFRIKPPSSFSREQRPPTNLHALWDAGVGLYPRIERPLTAEGRFLIELQANTIMASLPRASFRNVLEQRPMAWAQEGHQVAKAVAYQIEEDTVPTASYMRAGQAASARLSALAGYRLADLLNRTLP
jgi:hypothetical protein